MTPEDVTSPQAPQPAVADTLEQSKVREEPKRPKNLKDLFNWLTHKDDLSVTLGDLARVTIFRGTKLEEKGDGSFNFTRGGRLVERAGTLSAVFAGVAYVGFFASLSPFFTVTAVGAITSVLAFAAVGKIVGVAAGKVTDVVAKGINNSL